LGSASPESDIDDLAAIFDNDAELVFHPFFLTHLANLWNKGERFGEVGAVADRMARVNYVIETYINRETREKWRDRNGNELLTSHGHNVVVSSIAEEMWRTGAFRLQEDELRIAAELGTLRLADASLEVEKIKALAPTHAVFKSQDGAFSFRHDKFFRFFLGFGCSGLLLREAREDLVPILEAREFDPEVIDWVIWNLQRAKADINKVLRFLTSVNTQAKVSSGTVGALESNLSGLMAKLLPLGGEPISVVGFTATGNLLVGEAYKSVVFSEWSFWNCDWSKTKFVDCVFDRCRFGDVELDDKTTFAGVRFAHCQFTSGFEFGEEEVLFDPIRIEAKLVGMGAKVEHLMESSSTNPKPPAASKEAMRVVNRFIVKSLGTCDVAIEDINSSTRDLVDTIAKIGVEAGVMRMVTRQTSGPRKEFVRFTVDRDRLRKACASRSGDAAIDSFWTRIAEEYPDE
jgi:hypothetical protein